jgi:hypothetical protein
LKGCAFQLADLLLDAANSLGLPSILPTARFVLKKRLKKSHFNDALAVEAILDWALAHTSEVAATDGEIEFAAILVGHAQQANVDLDGGEALLLAVLVSRAAPLLLTGDKRALYATEVCAALANCMKETAGRLGCTEQTILALLTRAGLPPLQKGVCSEPSADTAVAICLSCHNAGVQMADVEQGLLSYINHLRASAPTVMVTSNDLHPPLIP